MAQITWRNVGGSGAGSALSALNKGSETILNAFDPLEQELKDRVSITDQNWDAQSAQNTRDVTAQLQNIGSLSELNKMQDAGQLSESAFNQQFGAQYDPTVVKQTTDARRLDLQNAASNAAIPEALAIADQSEDLLAGTKTLENKLRSANMREPEIQKRLSSFLQGNEARTKQYAKTKQTRLTKAINSVDMSKLSDHSDIAANVSQMIDSGINIDPETYSAALEDRLVDKRTDIDYKEKQAEKARFRQQRALSNSTRQAAMAAVRTTGDINSINNIIEKSGLDAERKNSMYGSLLPMLRQSSNLTPQQELMKNRQIAEYDSNLTAQANQRNSFISTQKAVLSRQNGIAPRVLKRVQDDIAANKDPYIPGLAEDDREIIATAEDKLQRGTIETGESAGQSFGFGPEEAKTVLALTLEQFRGRDITTDVFGGLLPGEDAKLDKDEFNLALSKTAADYRDYTMDSKELRKLENNWAQDQAKKKVARDNYEGSLILSTSKANLTGKAITPESLRKQMKARIPESLIKPIQEDQDYKAYVNTYKKIRDTKAKKAKETTEKLELQEAENALRSKAMGRSLTQGRGIGSIGYAKRSDKNDKEI